jgi:hypothetical protein
VAFVGVGLVLDVLAGFLQRGGHLVHLGAVADDVVLALQDEQRARVVDEVQR